MGAGPKARSTIADHRREKGKTHLGNPFGAVKNVKVERLLLFLRDELHAELVRRVGSGFDRIRKVAAEVVRVLSAELERLVPNETVRAQMRLPVEFDEGTLAFGVDEDEGVDAEALDHAVRARDRVVGQREERHEYRFGRKARPVPEGIMRSLRLRQGDLRSRLARVDQVDEFDSVLDEEHLHAGVTVSALLHKQQLR